MPTKLLSKCIFSMAKGTSGPGIYTKVQHRVGCVPTSPAHAGRKSRDRQLSTSPSLLTPSSAAKIPGILHILLLDRNSLWPGA